jgi:hypothetical protein
MALYFALHVNVGESDRDDQERERNADADVEEDTLRTSAGMEDAAFLAKNAAQTGPARLHEYERDQAEREDQFSNSEGSFQRTRCLTIKKCPTLGL